MSSDEGASRGAAQTEAFKRDVQELPAQALRNKYAGENNSHRAMKARCRNGGMTLAPEWQSFRQFLSDMGPLPEVGWTLDRLDSSLREYGPDLCRWADKKTQSENRTSTRWVEVNGETITVADLARLAGKPASTVYSAVNAGKSANAILRATSVGSTRSYAPSRLSEAEATAWLQNYETWLKRVPKSKRLEAPVEVYDIIDVSKQFKASTAWLDDRHFDSLSGTTEAADRLRLEASPQFAIVQHTPEWLRSAFEALTKRDPRLAARIAKGRHKGTFLEWEAYLLKPVTEAPY